MTGKRVTKKRKSPKSRPPLPPLNLDNLESSRNTLAELLKQYYQRKIADKRVRTLCFLYQTYLSYLKAETEFKFEKAILERIDGLEKRLQHASEKGT
jgi:hypothetical protein